MQSSTRISAGSRQMKPSGNDVAPSADDEDIMDYFLGKHPVLPDSASRTKLSERQSSKYTEKYADYLNLGVEEWRSAYKEHEKLRKQSNEIDNWDSPCKAIVSVMMLKEGWDVKNVTTIVGLRPYSAFGIITGLVSGFLGGSVDEFFMRIVDIFLSFPEMVAAMAVAGCIGA